MDALIYFQVWNAEAKKLFEHLRAIRPRTIKIWISEVVYQEWKAISYMPGLGAKDVAKTSLHKGNMFCYSFEWNITSCTANAISDDDVRGLLNVMSNTKDSKFMVFSDNSYPKNQWTLFRDIPNIQELPDVFFKLDVYDSSKSVLSFLYKESVIVFQLENNPAFQKIFVGKGNKPYYRCVENQEIWYLDTFHKDHYEVFEPQGKKHLGEADLDGFVDYTKADPSKQPLM